MVSLNNFFLGMPAWRGAYPALYCGTAPELNGQGFQYWGPDYLTGQFFMVNQRTPRNMVSVPARLMALCTSDVSQAVKTLEADPRLKCGTPMDHGI